MSSGRERALPSRVMRGLPLAALMLATGVGASSGTVAVIRLAPAAEVIEVTRAGTPGEQGERGPQGARGPQGERGERGPRGLTGAAGGAGVDGERGLRGLRGVPGLQGESGDVGAAGAKGDAGSAGKDGAKGDKGEKGEVGPAGVQGAQGPAGLDGAIGLAGLPGEPGPQGDKGDKGDTGGFGAHGSFYDTTDVPLNLDEATPVPLGQTDFASGVSIVGGSQITMGVKGRFNIAFSIQIEKSDAGTDWVSIWLRKNGDDVPWTNTDAALTGSDANSRIVVAWNFFVEATMIGDYWQLMIASTTSASGRMLIQSVDPQVDPVRPAIPGTILTVNQVG
jgi:hypothetical protein